jgi:hypothetical protein
MTYFPFGPRRLPPRYAALVMPLVLSILMSLIVSGVSTLKSLGIGAAFLATWPIAWSCPGWSRSRRFSWCCRWCAGSSASSSNPHRDDKWPVRRQTKSPGASRGFSLIRCGSVVEERPQLP